MLGLLGLFGLFGQFGLSTVVSAAAGEAVPCSARDLSFDSAAAGWKHVPMSKLKRDTVYTVSREDGRAVLTAVADRSASMYATPVVPPMRGPALLSWDWSTAAAVPGADNRDKSREDAPLRVFAAFDGDIGTLPDAERKRMERARSLSGRTPPFATLMYVWSEQIPVGTVVPSAHTSQVKMLVVGSKDDGLDRWVSLRRDLDKDFRQAFGKAPGAILGIGVMTDTDNTGAQAAGRYANIRFSCAG
jgi:hypothetical protein